MSYNKNIQSVKLAILSMLMLDCIDELDAHKDYKHRLKMTFNNAIKITNQFVKEYEEMLKKDSQLTINLFQQLNELIEKLSSMNVVDLSMLNNIINHYTENKEQYDSIFGIQMNEVK